MKDKQIPYIILVLSFIIILAFANPAYTDEYKNIPEKYKIETLNALMMEAKEHQKVVERCTEGINEKTIPESYKSYLYAVRAANYLRLGGDKKEMARLAGIDCMRSFEINSGNYSFCKMELDRYFALEGFVLAVDNTKKRTSYNNMVKAIDETSKQIKNELLDELDKTAKEENLNKGTEFIEKMRSEEIKIPKK